MHQQPSTDGSANAGGAAGLLSPGNARYTVTSSHHRPSISRHASVFNPPLAGGALAGVGGTEGAPFSTAGAGVALPSATGAAPGGPIPIGMGMGMGAGPTGMPAGLHLHSRGLSASMSFALGGPNAIGRLLAAEGLAAAQAAAQAASAGGSAQGQGGSASAPVSSTGPSSSPENSGDTIPPAQLALLQAHMPGNGVSATRHGAATARQSLRFAMGADDTTGTGGSGAPSVPSTARPAGARAAFRHTTGGGEEEGGIFSPSGSGSRHHRASSGFGVHSVPPVPVSGGRSGRGGPGGGGTGPPSSTHGVGVLKRSNTEANLTARRGRTDSATTGGSGLGDSSAFFNLSSGASSVTGNEGNGHFEGRSRSGGDTDQGSSQSPKALPRHHQHQHHLQPSGQAAGETPPSHDGASTTGKPGADAVPGPLPRSPAKGGPDNAPGLSGTADGHGHGHGQTGERSRPPSTGSVSQQPQQQAVGSGTPVAPARSKRPSREPTATLDAQAQAQLLMLQQQQQDGRGSSSAPVPVQQKALSFTTPAQAQAGQAGGALTSPLALGSDHHQAPFVASSEPGASSSNATATATAGGGGTTGTADRRGSSLAPEGIKPSPGTAQQPSNAAGTQGTQGSVGTTTSSSGPGFLTPPSKPSVTLPPSSGSGSTHYSAPATMATTPSVPPLQFSALHGAAGSQDSATHGSQTGAPGVTGAQQPGGPQGSGDAANAVTGLHSTRSFDGSPPGSTNNAAPATGRPFTRTSTGMPQISGRGSIANERMHFTSRPSFIASGGSSGSHGAISALTAATGGHNSSLRGSKLHGAAGGAGLDSLQENASGSHAGSPASTPDRLSPAPHTTPGTGTGTGSDPHTGGGGDGTGTGADAGAAPTGLKFSSPGNAGSKHASGSSGSTTGAGGKGGRTGSGKGGEPPSSPPKHEGANTASGADGGSDAGVASKPRSVSPSPAPAPSSSEATGSSAGARPTRGARSSRALADSVVSQAAAGSSESSASASGGGSASFSAATIVVKATGSSSSLLSAAGGADAASDPKPKAAGGAGDAATVPLATTGGGAASTAGGAAAGTTGAEVVRRDSDSDASTTSDAPSGGLRWTNAATITGSRDREIIDRRLAFKRLLQDGRQFRKYGRRGLPHSRLVFLTPDARTLVWCASGSRNLEKDGIAVADITDVIEGPNTPIFKKNAGWFKNADCCFSVVSAQRSLDLEAATTEERDEWVKAFLCLRKYRTGI